MTCTFFLLLCLWPLVALDVCQAQERLPPAPSATWAKDPAGSEFLSPTARGYTAKGATGDGTDEILRATPTSGVGGIAGESGILPVAAPREPFHWKGLLLQSLAFQALEHGPRIAAADAEDRHLLLNKPFWTDYRASVGQFNAHRWNDGDSVLVNYIGHPAQGAISGYIEVQNDPQGRDLQFANTSRYWKSRTRAFLWETVYSTEFEIGPISETSIFNQGGYTYPLGCKPRDLRCEKTARHTNNTGWVDFIVTPVGGTMMLVAGDAIDRYVSDRLIARHPERFRYKVLRGSLNPPRSLANMLRGRVPWYRDYDDGGGGASRGVAGGNGGEGERGAGIELQPFVSSVSLPDGRTPCHGCRRAATGPGVEVGVRAGRYVEAVSVVRSLGEAGSLRPSSFGGSLLLAHFGLRTGFAGPRFALGISVMPGFASYAKTLRVAEDGSGAATKPKRSFLFSAQAGVSGEARLTRRVGLRASVEQIIVRYKSDKQDPPGIGTPPRLNFLSHDNYINQTNWGLRVGPVLRF